MKKIVNMVFALVFISTVILIIFKMHVIYEQNSFIVDNGIADLKDRELKFIELNGMWEFYPNRLVTRGMLNKSNIKPIYISVPSSLQKFSTLNNIPKPSFGTYRCKIKSIKTNKTLALEIKNICSVYRLYINEKLIYENGKISEEERLYKTNFNKHLLFLPSNLKEMDIIIQVANFKLNKGGIIKPIIFGLGEELYINNIKDTCFNIFLIASLLLSNIYILSMYLYRKTEPILRKFIALFLGIIIKIIISEDLSFYFVYYDLNSQTKLIINCILMYLYIDIFSSLIREVYKNTLITKIISIILFLLVSVINIFKYLNYYAWGYICELYLVIIIIIITVVTVSFYLTLKIKLNKKYYYSNLGIVIICITVINNFLFCYEIIHSNQILFFVYLILVYKLAIIKSIEFALSYSQIKILSQELLRSKINTEMLNKNLENIVKNRTKELNYANNQLKVVNNELIKEKKIREDLLANISHDLRTPITTIRGYIEAIEDGIICTEKDIKKYLHRMYLRTLDLEHLIKDLFQLTKLATKEIQIQQIPINLKSFMKEIYIKYEFDMLKKHIKFEVITEDDEVKNVSVLADKARIVQVFDNLINNAVRYIQKDASIQIICSTYNKDYILFQVKDNGIGISKNDIKYIFNRFFKVSKDRNKQNSGSGLGLSIVQQIIHIHNGEIWAESIKGKGCSIFFTLPIKKVDSLIK